MKNKLKSTKAITLVALIITVIVMLILVGATVSVVINSNLLGTAKSAVDRTKTAYDKEKNVKIMIGGIETSIDEIVGDKVNYSATVNPPELIDGMIAVKWNGTNWVKADKTKTDWYEYGTNRVNKKWANAVTVKTNGSKTREYYSQATEETIIPEEDIIGMYVWIPRYAYKIVRGYHQSNDGNSEAESGFVDIKFLNGTQTTGDDIVEYNDQTTKEGEKSFAKFPDGYVVHPAFTLGETELTGIWVAKFEASSNTTTTRLDSNIGENCGSTAGNNADNIGIGNNEVTVRPNVTSWRSTSVDNCYKACVAMVSAGNIHGLSNGDSHLMKETEWGAVAYLTQSPYGNAQVSKTTGVWHNSYYAGDGYYGTRTGMVFKSDLDTETDMKNSRDNTTNNQYTVQTRTQNEDGSVTIKYDDSGTEVEKTFYEYNTEYGVRGSTTGTIYGIYDMSGGATEIQASYLSKVENEYTNYFNNIENVPEKHKTKYSGTGGQGTCYSSNKALYGNALWETSTDAKSTNWNGNGGSFVLSTSPFPGRGGHFVSAGAGGFYFTHYSGKNGKNVTFRPVMSGVY